MTIRKRLYSTGLSLTLIPLLLVVTIAVIQSGKTGRRTTETTEVLSSKIQEEVLSGIFSVITSQQELLEQKVSSDLNVARDKIKALGEVRFSDTTVQWTAVNQYTKDKTALELPMMYVGNQWLGQNDSFSEQSLIVDEVQNLVGGTCTIFQRMNSAGDMLRISTNVKKLDGKRAIGTYIPAVNPDGSPNPVLKKILKGESFSGRAYVVNAWYITRYEPITDAGGDVIGILYTGVAEQGTESLRKQILDITIGKSGYAAVLDSGGNYIISDRGERDGENVIKEQDSEGRFYIQEMIENALTLEEGESARIRYSLSENKEQGSNTFYYSYFKKWDWIIFINAYDKEIFKDVEVIYNINRQNRNIMIIIMVCVLLITVFIWQVVASSIIGPLKQSVSMLKDISEGEGDLTKRLNDAGNDETSHLSQYFNLFVSRLNSIITHIRENMNLTKKNGRLLSQSMKETREAAIQISELTDNTNSIISEQSGVIDRVTTSVEGINSIIHKQDQRINEQTDSVTQSSSAIEQMVASIQSISDNLASSTREFEILGSTVHSGSSSLDQLKQMISNLSQQSVSVMEANTIIQDIASRTNLLAMNAAIEAAHAGESGRGFAVVAEEIRKLAETSNNQSVIIAENLKNLENIINNAVEISQKTADSFATIVKSVESVTTIEKQISFSLEEQSAGSSEVLSGLTEISEITQDIRSGSTEIMSESTRVLDNVKGLVSLTENIKNHMNDVMNTNATINTVVESAADLLDENMTHISEMDDQLNGFKTEK